MPGAAGFVLILDDARYEVFLERLDEGRLFAEPVPEFAHSGHKPLVCFVIHDGVVAHLARGQRGVSAGTDYRRLNLIDVDPQYFPVTVSSLMTAVPTRFRKRATDRFVHGGLLTPKTFESVVDAFVGMSEEAAVTLRVFSAERRRRVAGITGQRRVALAQQKEAVSTALTFAGIPRSRLAGWDYSSSEDEPQSYLDGLSEMRLREDQMILNDLRCVPGFEAVRDLPHVPAVVFEDGQTRLTIALANRMPLEQQLGVDLIYRNETFNSFVMVQYKAMEKEKRQGISTSVFRLPNQQLDAEVQHMDTILGLLAKSPVSRDTDDYRLSENPFYLKLCSRVVFDPDDDSLVSGMYLPLDYWKRLCTDDRTLGPRSGRLVCFENATRYFDNTSFTRLVAGGWVGTNVHQTDVLDQLVREILTTGRAVVLATKEDVVVDDNDFISIDDWSADG